MRPLEGEEGNIKSGEEWDEVTEKSKVREEGQDREESRGGRRTGQGGKLGRE